MDEKKPSVPKLRFPGFTDPWEQRKLGDLASFTKGSGYSKSDIKSHGKPLILYGSLYTDYKLAIDAVNTFADEQIGSTFSRGGEVVVPSSGETSEDIAVASAVMLPGVMIGSGLNVIVPGKELDPVFLAISITGGRQHRDLARKAQGKSVVHLYNDDIAASSIDLPALSEQLKIRTLFLRIDSLITLHQRKLEHLREMKRGLLQKMFPRDGESAPELRFPGFTDPWEQRKFGDMYRRAVEKNDGSFGEDKIISVANMHFKPVRENLSKGYLQTYNVMLPGDIAFEGNRSKHFAHGRFVENTIGPGIVSHVFEVFRPTSPYEITYWKYAINNEYVMRKILARATKASTMMHSLVAKDFLAEAVCVPSLREQARIGEFFARLDSLITLHQRKLEHLQEMKKGLLQQMFV
ncbi:restriction endonuclease subunit S [Granulimonas faecalis]|uniref:restriction endonuclease subunit S n=1 Tax=Granulimonas faecalis TaxID=2894155 RepID=UPI003518A1DB